MNVDEYVRYNYRPDAGPQQRFPCPFCEDPARVRNFCIGRDGNKLLWMCQKCEAHGMTPAEQATQYQAVRKPVQPAPTRQATPPAEVVRHPSSGLSAAGEGYFLSRGISGETATRAGVVSDDQSIAFPYRGEKGNISAYKYRGISEKKFWQKGVCETWWNKPDKLTGDDILLVEGEIDALSLMEVGFTDVMSIPNGAPQRVSDSKIDPSEDGKFRYVWTAKELFQSAKRVVLFTDADEPGKALAEELARRIGKARCWRVAHPDGCKDANDVLLKLGPQALKDAIAAAEPWPINGIHTTDFYAKAVEDLYIKGTCGGASTGIPCVDEIYTMAPGMLTVVTGTPGSGKALSLDTRIPTPSGWTTMGEIKVGDRVFDEFGRSCNVVAATDVMLDRPCYRIIFDDGIEVVADENHQWLTNSNAARMSARDYRRNWPTGKRGLSLRGSDQSHKRTFPKVVTTGEISNTLIYRGKKNHAISLASPLALPDRHDLVVDPYTLGAWLGDGTSTSGGFTCHEKDSEIIKNICVSGLFVRKNKAEFSHTIHGLVGSLRELGVLNNKHIPERYLRASYDQRLSLLQGLMDTDGTCSRQGNCELSFSSKRLTEDSLELINSLGLKAKLSVGRAILNGACVGERYRIFFNPNIPVFRLARKLARISYKPHRLPYRIITECSKIDSVPVRCIQVDSSSSLFLITEHFIPTHNSSLFDQIMINVAQRENWNCAVASFENPQAIHIAKLSSIITGKPFFDGASPKMTKAEMDSSVAWLNDRFFFLDGDGGLPTIEDVIQRLEMAVMRWGIRVAIIDPFSYLARDKGMAEHEWVNYALSLCKQWALAHDAHIICVAHPQKMMRREDGTTSLPGGYDISGAAGYFNKADVGLTVARGNDGNGQNIVKCWKSRFPWIGSLGQVDVQYDVVSGRFLDPSHYTPPPRQIIYSAYSGKPMNLADNIPDIEPVPLASGDPPWL